MKTTSLPRPVNKDWLTLRIIDPPSDPDAWRDYITCLALCLAEDGVAVEWSSGGITTVYTTRHHGHRTGGDR